MTFTNRVSTALVCFFIANAKGKANLFLIKVSPVVTFNSHHDWALGLNQPGSALATSAKQITSKGVELLTQLVGWTKYSLIYVFLL